MGFPAFPGHKLTLHSLLKQPKHQGARIPLLREASLGRNWDLKLQVTASSGIFLILLRHELSLGLRAFLKVAVLISPCVYCLLYEALASSALEGNRNLKPGTLGPSGTIMNFMLGFLPK